MRWLAMGALLLAAFVFASVGSAAPPGSANLKVTKTDVKTR